MSAKLLPKSRRVQAGEQTEASIVFAPLCEGWDGSLKNG
jgi:hypothetical protein